MRNERVRKQPWFSMEKVARQFNWKNYRRADLHFQQKISKGHLNLTLTFHWLMYIQFMTFIWPLKG